MSAVKDETAFGDVVMGGLTNARLPRLAVAYVAVPALALGALLWVIFGWGPVGAVIVAGLLVLICLPLWSRFVEGPREAADRLVSCLVWGSLLVTLVPLFWVLAKTIIEGAPTIDWAFLSHDMVQQLDPVTFKQLPGNGVLHALIGTLLITLAATLISVPIGLMTAVYLVEYGEGRAVSRAITLLVDVMTGIPSIVAGLFALSLFTTFGSPGTRMGIMGSVALSLLMIPTVVRSAEEMMRLVPNDLREASYALGVPKWRTIVKVVVPTSIGGIVTGVMLAISRVIGETAPLLVAVGSIDQINTNLFNGRMQTLPVFITTQYKESTPEGYALAWGGALLLIVIVMVLNLFARIIGKFFAPKTGR